MNKLKNAMSLWNEGGLIPIFGTFMSWMTEANKEMNDLGSRLSSATLFISRFVTLYKKQQVSLKNEKKKSDDLQFENEILKKENETLCSDLLSLYGGYEQIKNLNARRVDKSKKLISKLENIEKVHDEDNQAMHEIENVTIFETNSPKSPKKKRFKSSRIRTKSSPPKSKQQQQKVKKAYVRNTVERPPKRKQNLIKP